MCIQVILQRQTNLLQIVSALRSPGSLPGLLDGGQQQCNQHRDDGDDDQ